MKTLRTPSEFFILDQIKLKGYFVYNSSFRSSLKNLYFSKVIKADNANINASFSNVEQVRFILNIKPTK